jgi:hypothetical protein
MAHPGNGPLHLRLAWARPATTPPIRLATHSSQKEPQISARSERMAARSNKDGGAAVGCEDREWRAAAAHRGGCPGVGGGRVEERARVLSYEHAADAFFV